MRIILIGIACVALYRGAHTLAAFTAKERIVEELVAAAKDEDRATVEDRVDWGSIRDFAKADLKRKSEAVRAGGQGVALGPHPSKIDEIVDFYVQPENIDLLFALRPKVFPKFETRDFVHRVSLRGLDGFEVTIGYPKAPEGSDRFQQPVFSEQLLAITFVFRLDGWTWRAKEMHVPLFMTPVNIFSDEDIERFLSRNAP